MTSLEAVSLIHTLPPALSRRERMPAIPSGLLKTSVQKVSLILQDAADSLRIELDHRQADAEETDPAADLHICVVDRVHPFYLQRIGQIMLNGRAHAIQIVSMTPIPDEDWLTHHTDSQSGLLNAHRTEGGVLVPQTDTSQSHPERIHIDTVDRFTLQNATLMLQIAAELRDIFGRNF